jgi:hypothetical protein
VDDLAVEKEHITGFHDHRRRLDAGRQRHDNETASFLEAQKEDRIDLLLNQIEVKFGISPEIAETVAADLAQLDMNVLKALFRQLLRLETFEQLEVWIADHLPERSA